MSPPRVEVLLSAFDGALFIGEQLESILAQGGVELRVTVRDDGSRDETLAVLGSCADPRLTVRAGNNLGLPAAFFHLIDESDDRADLYALSDQDDVWLPGKLARAAAALEGLEDRPALYAARVLVTDERLRPLYPHPLPMRGPSFANALAQNIALGCTTVLNRPARDLVRGRWPQQCVMHDSWLYLVVAGLGTVVYDPEVTVLYRQHVANAVGMGNSALRRFQGRLQRQRSGGAGKHGRQDLELLRLFGEDLRPEARAELEDLLASRSSPVSRLHYALSGPAHRQSVGSDLVLKGLGALGRL